MPKITIYTSKYCPYCSAAKRLLDKKGAASSSTARCSRLVIRGAYQLSAHRGPLAALRDPLSVVRLKADTN